MIAKQILRMVRQKEKDNNEARWSDYDILDALNECLRYFNAYLTNKDSEWLQAIKEYREDDMNAEIGRWNLEHPDEKKPSVSFAKTGVELPEDFVAIANIYRISDRYRLHVATASLRPSHNEFVVFGGRIYCNYDFELQYYRQILAVTDKADEISLPDIMLDPIIKITRLILNNADVDTMTQAITDAVEKMIPRRRYNNARQVMPWYM